MQENERGVSLNTVLDELKQRVITQMEMQGQPPGSDEYFKGYQNGQNAEWSWMLRQIDAISARAEANKLETACDEFKACDALIDVEHVLHDHEERISRMERNVE